MSDEQCKQNGRRWKVRYTVLLLLWLCWMFSFLDRMVITVALPFIGKDFDIGPTGQGFIISIFFAGYAICQIPGGMMADKFGFRRVISVALGWWSVFTILTGLMFTYPLMLIVRFLFGLGEAPLPGSSYKGIATYFSSKQRGTATGIQSTVNTLGPACATIAAAAIISAFGWRPVFIAIGIPGLVVALMLWLKVKDNPKDHPKITKEEIEELEEDATSEADRSGGVGFKEVLRKPILWQATLIWFFFDITFWGFTSWLPSYLINVRGFSLMSTGIFSALPYLIGTVTMVLGGYLSDRTPGKRKWIFIPNAIIGAVTLFLMFQAPSNTMVIVFQCIAAFFMFMAQGSFWGLVVDSLPAKLMATGSSVVNCAGSIAGFISPFVMGFMIDVSGGSYGTAFIFIAIALIISAIVALTIRAQSSKKEISPAAGA
ncbi:sugar phosphate permease [Scopulibacillus darangshiensis]|uniref:Sugar phosphate permease n=1 Tax=Scopulibacillus darangshiensis TaxID=442528 RepID=A0A4R2NK08_9BACL|nr:MFS transporter [Scopulibacillus darangshiensis]TCP21658.1 sugar phosphate permease [Scopulibacillus darangshiensis]